MSDDQDSASESLREALRSMMKEWQGTIQVSIAFFLLGLIIGGAIIYRLGGGVGAVLPTLVEGLGTVGVVVVTLLLVVENRKLARITNEQFQMEKPSFQIPRVDAKVERRPQPNGEPEGDVDVRIELFNSGREPAPIGDVTIRGRTMDGERFTEEVERAYKVTEWEDLHEPAESTGEVVAEGLELCSLHCYVRVPSVPIARLVAEVEDEYGLTSDSHSALITQRHD